MAEMKEDRPVGRAAEGPGDAPHGRGTIDAGHHVDNHVMGGAPGECGSRQRREPARRPPPPGTAAVASFSVVWNVH